ncbi:transposase [Listeria seeligeri]|uniref:transposase n=1 Tax=Listeria seeligeri TaxID=1640 RepID=UPI0022EBC35B|nr:transposase [Listeria seeligeri]
MAKYDDGFKRKVVEAYQNGEGGYRTLAQRFGISHFSLVRKWVKIVEARGVEHYKGEEPNNIMLPNSSKMSYTIT